MAAVLVPPSACSTSQSMTMVFSPSAFASMQARSDRPTSREISWVRPPILPLTDSRSVRVLVERGSIAYSAVTQPWPLPRRHRGRSSCTLAAQSTRVAPNSTRTEPSACASQPRLIVMSRSWSGRRPSGRMKASLLASGPPWLASPVLAGAVLPARRAVAELPAGVLGRASLDPPVHAADAVGERNSRDPAEVAPGALRRQRAAAQLTWPRCTKYRVQLVPGHLADHGGELEDADFGARADVPDAGTAPVCCRQISVHRVPDVDKVPGLLAVAVDHRPLPRERTRAEDRHHAHLAGRVLSRPVDVREPQHHVR